MTRFARGYKKSFEDATSWDEMKKKQSNSHGKRDGEFKNNNGRVPLRDDETSIKRREARRKRRQKAKVCFGCREHGHALAECPKRSQASSADSHICFSCGSTEHSLKQCKEKKKDGELPFAKCFVCGTTGHISGKCPNNPNGLYPDGGCCKICGSTAHLRRDCPDLYSNARPQTNGDGNTITVSKATSQFASIDSIEQEEAKEEIKIIPWKKKKAPQKIVKF